MYSTAVDGHEVVSATEGLTKPSILLADDDVAYRNALQKFLEPQFEITASVGDGPALVEAAQRLSPDVIIADISMPVLNGLQAIRRLKLAQPDTRVIILTIHEEPTFAAQAKTSGVLGYVLKRLAGHDLIPAIRAVLQGKPFPA